MSAEVAVQPRTPFFMIANEIIDWYRLNPYELALYNAIVRHLNYKTREAYPSIRRLAQLTQMTRPTVIKYIRSLEEKGLIRVRRAYKEGSRERAVNRYEILPPSPYCDERPTSAAAPEAREAGSSNEPKVVHEVDDVGLPDEPKVVYAVNQGGQRDIPEVVNEVDEGGKRDEPGVVNAVDRNETGAKKTEPNNTLKREDPPNQRGPALRAGSRSPEGDAPAPAAVLSSSEDQAALKRENKRDEWDEFCYALADVCQLDFEANQGRIRKTASALWRKGTGYSIADLYTFEQWWYQQDWRGKKGECPRLQYVAELIRAATAADEAAAAARRRGEIARFVGDYGDIIQY